MKFPHAQKKEMKSWKLKIPKTMRGCKRSGDTIFIFLYFLYLQVSVTIISITNSIQAKYFESSVCDQVQTILTEEILKKNLDTKLSGFSQAPIEEFIKKLFKILLQSSIVGSQNAMLEHALANVINLGLN